jgi:LysM repeat protein
MRTQAITTPLGDSCDPAGWRADSVDSRGWLAGAGSPSPVPRATDGAEAAAAAERAIARAARRSANGRRRRRVRTRSTSRSLALARATVVDHQAVGRPAADTARRSAAAGQSEVDGYRMGRWARLALTLTVLAAIAVVTVALVAGSAPQPMVDVTVGPGDTLWSIATHAAPDRDPRDVIEEIKALNDVPGSVLPVGVVLRVPASTG